MKKTINILGERYKLRFKNYLDDPLFAQRHIDGYHDSIDKQIVVCNMKTYPSWENETAAYCQKVEKQILRHEIIHAFLTQSGLDDNSNRFEGAWAKNEEMIDFFALQSPKIVKIFSELDIL